MSYEKELEYLRKEFNKSSAKFHQAEAEGYETDAEMWENDMVNIGHQIHIHEQAAKADEYEAKAEAFDDIVGKYEGIMKEVRSRKFKVTSDVTLLGLEAEKVIKKYESGEPNE